MFLDTLLQNNPELVEYTCHLHKKGLMEPDTYVLDVDRIISNYQLIADKAKAYNIETFVMTKQFGRHPLLIQELSKLGAKFVAVDFREAKVILKNKGKIAHIGHLVQIPINMIPSILQYRPYYVTVYSIEQAYHVNEYAKSQNFIQNVFIRVIKTACEGQKTQIYNQETLLNYAQRLQQLSHINLVGMTSFPCFLFIKDHIVATDNTHQLIESAEFLNSHGFNIKIKNMPSHNSCASIPLIAEYDGQQIEPGHALTGTCPYHKIRSNSPEEKIAILYLSEVSHRINDISYIYGGGYYRRSHWEYVYTPQGQKYPIIPPDPTSIDYTIGIKGKLPVGETILSSFRTQIFVTRSEVALVKGLSKNSPQLLKHKDIIR